MGLPRDLIITVIRIGQVMMVALPLAGIVIGLVLARVKKNRKWLFLSLGCGAFLLIEALWVGFWLLLAGDKISLALVW